MRPKKKKPLTKNKQRRKASDIIELLQVSCSLIFFVFLVFDFFLFPKDNKIEQENELGNIDSVTVLSVVTVSVAVVSETALLFSAISQKRKKEQQAEQIDTLMHCVKLLDPSITVQLDSLEKEEIISKKDRDNIKRIISNAKSENYDYMDLEKLLIQSNVSIKKIDNASFVNI